jgi:uncharacterized protein YdeI (BOF family)
MKRVIVKLLTIGLSLAVFAGCAGNSVRLEVGDGSVIAAMIEESFPSLDAKIKSTERYIEYHNISLVDADKLKQSLETKGFSSDNVTYEKEITYKGTSYAATAKISPVKSAEEYNVILRIDNKNGDVDDKYVFDDVFGRIDSKFSYAALIRVYDRHVESHFKIYDLKLRRKYGFKRDEGGVLSKNDGNFYYQWIVSYAVFSDDPLVGWSIERLPQ